MKRFFRKTLVCSAILAASLNGNYAFADNVSGSIYGKATEGYTVVIKNKSTGFKRSIVVGADGRFNFSSLPTGSYEVTDGDEKRDIVVAIGQGTQVNFSDGFESIEVVGSAIAGIDTSSVESTTVFTSEQIDLLPLDRDITSVSLLAPGAVGGDSGFDNNLASFGGSSVAENGYFINGFDVTNIRNFTSFADLPYDAVAQQQVRTGGYGAEYGRSLGGVVSIVTKRGSNEFEFGGSVQWEPDDWRAPGTDAPSRNPDQVFGDRFQAYRSANTFDYLTYNVYASGPIIEDKLFFYVLAQGRDDKINDYNTQTSEKIVEDSPTYMAKIDWNITDSHLLELTYIDNEQDTETTPYRNADGDFFVPFHGEQGNTFTETNGGNVKIVNYTGYLTDNFTLKLLWGEMESFLDKRTPLAGPGFDCPLVFDRRETPNTSQRIGCWGIAESQFNSPDADGQPDEDIRESIRIGLEWVLGDHTIRAGFDKEEFESVNLGTTFSGGEYWRWHIAQDINDTGGQIVNGEFVPVGTEYIRHRERNTESASFEVENTAFYIEDSWQVTDEWLVYLGLRSEAFENRNGAGEIFVKSDDELAPRLGFSWDIGGEGDRKLYGTYGRYYIPIASNTNIRASGSEFSFEEYFFVDSADEDPVTAAPTQVGAQIGPRNENGGAAPDSRTVAISNLEPMHQDEFILGYEQRVGEWVLGVKGIYRDVKDGMDDFCSSQGFIDWAEDNGHTNFDYHTLAQCIIMNPGKDWDLAVDLNNDGNLVDVTIPAEYFNLEEYKREYKAVELTFEKPFTDGWYLQGSYTWAESTGNIEGYVNSTLEQEDAGLTQDFDHYAFQLGSDGHLPNDREHTFKVFGAYQWNDEVTMSANLQVQSGRPVSCYGYLPLTNPDFVEEIGSVDAGQLSGYGASTFFCNGTLGSRGDFGRTPWTRVVDMGIAYRPMSVEGLTLKLDFKNIFNFQEISEFVEQGEVGSANAATPNPDFLTPLNFQTPRRVLLTARYRFSM